ncbi:MAG: hypothetical protein J3R72DRAFT_521539 [Linnemannia gamsii]|nr:MAG: hypothetical protein J3R72DRAFT_521539 [Linnemannia gamsii]
MDCNWCAVCSKHFHCDDQTSLYCSESCRKEDALACCAFHDCDHPDGSAHHDHLTFCHHHRPAIRIPAMMPLLNLNPNPSLEQQAHGQHQTNEWMRFLQQQYSGPYHAHPVHTSMVRPTMSVGGPGVAAGPGGVTSAGASASRGQLAVGQGQSQPPHRHHHHFHQESTFHGHHSHSHIHNHHQHPCSAPVHYPQQQHTRSSFLMSSELPVIPCEELQQRAQFLRQQKPAASQFHKRHSSQSSICHGATGISPSSVCGGSGGECEPRFLKSVFLSSSCSSSLSPTSPPFVPFQAKRSSCFEGERGVAPAAGATAQVQAGIGSITPCEVNDCEQPCVVRKNKVLPPPTLSPLLPVTISNPASLSPTSPIGTNPVSPTLSSASSSSSGYTDEEDSDDALSHAWPKMDQLFFPDHCCRTSACGVPPRPSSTSGGRNNKNGRKNNNNKTKKEFVSELPPPPNHHRPDEKSNGDNGGCMALSASIWGTGWHQVEPLPASFVKTLKASNMLWSGCEKEHYHHHNHHHYGARRQQNQQNRGRRDSGHCGGGGRRSSKRDQGNDSSSWSTVCPGRLPRSLQFID